MGSSTSHQILKHKELFKLSGIEDIDDKAKAANDCLEIGRTIHAHMIRLKLNDYNPKPGKNIILGINYNKVLGDIPNRVKYLSEQVELALKEFEEYLENRQKLENNSRIVEKFKRLIKHNKNAYQSFLKKCQESTEIALECISRMEYRELLDMNTAESED